MHIKIHKGDTIRVLAGKDRGKNGTVMRVLPKERKLVVEGINLVKKHTKPTRKEPHGGVMSKPSPMPVSRVMALCPRCQKPTRIGVQTDPQGKRQRVCKKCGEFWPTKEL